MGFTTQFGKIPLDTASAVVEHPTLTQELDRLVNQQICTLKQNAKISDPELSDYRQRSLRIQMLYRRLNAAGRQTWAKKHAA